MQKETPALTGALVSDRGDQEQNPTKCEPRSQVEADAIRLLMPAIEEDERQLRQALRNAQTWAASFAARTPSESARSLLWLINATAARWTFAAATCESLTYVRQTCLYLRMAANHFDRLEGGNG